MVLEAFDGLSDFRLDVCCPSAEKDFWDHYRPLLDRNKNIVFHGFVPVGGALFESLTRRAAFNIFPGSAEACATSVITCMRRGVIPVVTVQTGVDDEGFGFTIDNLDVNELRNLIIKISEIGVDSLRERVIKTYNASMGYTIDSYSKSFNSALLRVINP